MEQTKKCPFCGKEILAVAKKCKHCGEWLYKEVEPISHTDPHLTQPDKTIITKKKGIGKGIFVTLLVLLAIIFVGLFIILIHQGKENNIAKTVKEDPVINFAEAEEDEAVYQAKESEQPTPKAERREENSMSSEAENDVIDNYGSEELLSLGESYEKGIGVEENHEMAFYYYQKAAETGDPTALNKIGNMYAQGKGCTKKKSKAASYYLAAAEMGNKYAQHNVAWCYWDGVGIEKNQNAAIMWMRRSAAQGFEKAIKALKTMEVE